MERETGIEPATNGLEGRDSATELLPLREPNSRAAAGWRVKPRRTRSKVQGGQPPVLKFHSDNTHFDAQSYRLSCDETKK